MGEKMNKAGNMLYYVVLAAVIIFAGMTMLALEPAREAVYGPYVRPEYIRYY